MIDLVKIGSFISTVKKSAKVMGSRLNFIDSATNFPIKPEIEKSIFAKILKKAIKQSFVVNVLEIPVIFLTYLVLISAQPSIYVHFWLVYHLLVSNGVRSFFIYLYHSEYKQNDVVFWRRNYAIMSFLTGSSWGIVGSFLMPANAPDTQVCIFLLIFGLGSVGMPLLAPMLREYAIFLLSLMVPFTIWLILHEGKIALFSFLLPCWITLTLVAAYHTRNLLINGLALHYENKELFDETIKAKIDLEEINNNLIFEIRLRKAAEKRLESIATHDTLTGLPNRVLLHSFLNETLAKADVMQNIVAVVFIDMDNFKPINDNFGHDAGDRLLSAIGERLRYRIRKSDFVCRIGGDEFVVVITNLRTPTMISQIVDNILLTLSEQYTIERNRSISLSASAGISIYPQDAKSLDQLIKFADIAMYQAKEEGGNTFRFYSRDFPTDFPHSP